MYEYGTQRDDAITLLRSNDIGKSTLRVERGQGEGIEKTKAIRNRM